MIQPNYNNNNKKIYSQSRSNSNSQVNLNYKLPFVRRTDYTDDKNSEFSNNHLQFNHFTDQQDFNNSKKVDEEQSENNLGESQYSRHIKPSPNQAVNGFHFVGEKQQKIIELRERLKNIHHFYKIRIDEERAKNIERNEIFISIIEELQRHHNEKIIVLQKTLQDLDNDKQQISMVDQRMGSIKNTIEDILKQSQQLKQKNEKLEKEISEKQLTIKQKELMFTQKKEQLYSLRDRLEQFQRLKIKQNRRNKQLVEMIDHTF